MRRRGAPSNDRAATSSAPATGAASGGWYTRLLTTHPIKTKAITLGLLNLVGDVVTQLFVEKSGKLDFRRTASMTSLGLFIVGPILHYWYGFMNRVVKAPGIKGVAFRLILDQDWKPTVIANWKLWVPFQFCNFMFVPPILQVLFSNVVGLVWNVYISYVSHNNTGQGGSNKQVLQQMETIEHVPHEPQQPFLAEPQQQQLQDTQQQINLR